MTEHTATPWKKDFFDVTDKQGNKVANCFFKNGKASENAEFIVLACNSHEELVKALKLARVILSSSLEDYDGSDDSKTINQALAKAEGGAE